MYVERLISIFIPVWDIFYAFYVTDLRYDTISVSCIKFCLFLINSARKLKVVVIYTNFITYRMYCFKTNVYNVCINAFKLIWSLVEPNVSISYPAHIRFKN